MVRKILIGIAALIVLLVCVIFTRPSSFHIERSITIAAPAESAFARVNDFHAWAAWSPWEKLDPQMQRTFDGPPSGAGAIYAWTGNDQVGEGRMTIVNSTRPSEVDLKLEFFRPWQATNAARFTFTPVRAGTQVTWAMDGHNNFAAKAAFLFMDVDKRVGSDFERGLTALKTVTENAPKANAEPAPAVD